ncbi:MAG: sensor domain-containing diguanylate cyclase [Treponema sp.]|nr:sensor domain-containing diguanylate cyclase [Treponema sp.]
MGTTDIENKDAEEFFITNPKVMENYSFLHEVGVFSFIDSLVRNINNYKSLLTNGLGIFDHVSPDEIMDAAIKQISYSFLPSYITFIWKPIQNRPDIDIRTYANYRPVDSDLKIDNMALFENFFQKFPRPVTFDDLLKKTNNNAVLAPFKALQTEVIIPIIGPFGLYGIILVGRKIPADKYTKDEMEFLYHLMSFVSQAIKSHLHYEHSLRDVKTGLYNHGFFMARLKEEAARIANSSLMSSVIVLDIDNFKNFNDLYGHLAGDQVLEKIAQAIRKNIRTDDIPSRFGGEEFTIMLPNTDTSAAWTIAEKLRVNVSKMQVPWEIPLPHVTVSLGIFTFDQNSRLNADDILHYADEALYVSKATGRNRSTIWKPDLLESTHAMIFKDF